MSPLNELLLTVAAQVDVAFRRTGKSVKQIAQEIGVKPNVFSMIKAGTVRVPLERVPALADALDMERWVLMYICLAEYHPSLYAALEASFPGINLSPADVDWLPRARRFFLEMVRIKRRARKVKRSGGGTINYSCGMTSNASAWLATNASA